MLKVCLELLAPGIQTLAESEYEVIVTDDGTTANAKSLIKQNFTWAKWVEGPKRGPAANRNNGANLAVGDWLVFIDDDCLPNNNLLNSYIEVIRQHEDVCVFEGLIYCDEVRRSPLQTSPTNTNGGHLWSCNFCIKRNFFRSINGFDENYLYPNLEDNDLHKRISLRHIPIVFAKNASVMHPLRPIASPKKLAKYHESWMYFHKKFHDPKTLNDLLKEIIKNKVYSVLRHPFSIDSLIVFYNLMLELIYTIKFSNNWEKQ